MQIKDQNNIETWSLLQI